MMKTLTLLAVAMVAPVWAADEPKPNPVVEKAMAAALADAEKGYDAYKVVLAKATDKAVKDMEKAKLDAMKKGDLASANELDARIKEMKDGGLEKLMMERKGAGGDLLGDSSAQPIVGTWNITYNNGTQRTIVVDGKLSVSVVGGAGAGSSYELTYDSKSKVYIGYFSPDKTKPETYKVAKGQLEVLHWANGGDWKSQPPTHTASGTKK